MEQFPTNSRTFNLRRLFLEGFGYTPVHDDSSWDGDEPDLPPTIFMTEEDFLLLSND